MYKRPLDYSLDFYRGYVAGQLLAQVFPTANDRAVRTIALRRFFEANQRELVDCPEFIGGMSNGYRDELAGLAHPLSESEEE
jgi:hypothetical protein